MTETSKISKTNNASVGKFFKETKAELKKVIWPDKKQLANSVGIVLGSIFVVTLVISLFDVGIGAIVKVFTK
jgi:preprotein translocase subunit SecE